MRKPKLAILPSLLFIGLFNTCKTPKVTVQSVKDDAKPELNAENRQGGFYYTLPKTAFAVSIKGTIRNTSKGQLSEFDHLLDYPSGTIYKASKTVLSIDELEVSTYPVPDYEKTFFVNIPKEKAFNFKTKKYGFEFGALQQIKSIGLNDSKKHQENLNTKIYNKNIRIKGKQQKEAKKVDEAQLKFDQKAFKKGLNQLNRKSNDLKQELAQVSSDTLNLPDSIANQKLNKIEQEIKKYRNHIEKLGNLYKTYRGENIANTAQKYKKIIKKLINLKTQVAGGQKDLSYNNVPVNQMINSLDTLINKYLQAFKGSASSYQDSWQFQVVPDQTKRTFRYGIYYNEEDEFVLKKFQQESRAEGQLVVTFKPVFSDQIEQHQNSQTIDPNGFYYNIPANGTLKIELIKDNGATRITLAKARVKLPQFGELAQLPANFENAEYDFDPLTGGLQKLKISK